MTINQYQRLATTIANKIIERDGDPNSVRRLEANNAIKLDARDPHNKDAYDKKLSITSGDFNVELVFDSLSNPNNPNYKFRTLKPGSISAYNAETDKNIDLTSYHFDTAQFKKLIDVVKDATWTLN